MMLSILNKSIIKLTSVCLLWLCAFAAYGQQAQVDKIKHDPNYYWGEGTGTTEEDADADAFAQMARSIWTLVYSKTSEESSEKSIFISSVTINTIPDAKMILLSPEPNCKVFRYVEKAVVLALKEGKKRYILDLIETGRKAEKRLQIDDALRSYHWAYLMTKASPEPIYTEINGKNVDALSYLPTKINTVLKNIKANLADGRDENGLYLANMHFSYNGNDVASLQVYYNDGTTWVGPINVRDGMAELELTSLPINKKIPLRFEYRFKKEAVNMGGELQAVANAMSPYMVDATIDVPIKVKNDKEIVSGGDGKIGKSNLVSDSPINLLDEKDVPPEAVRIKERIPFREVIESGNYKNALELVERAIKAGDPSIARSCFSTDHPGYEMFETLLKKTGKVQLVGEHQDYEFVEANGQILARFVKVKIKFKNGQTFNENLVFRFLPDGKIESLAMALTKKAEDDILSASLNWPDVSRFTIQRFMEDYQTAYALKRLDFIESIFSDDAIIITGSVLSKNTKNSVFEGKRFDFGNGDTNVRYTKQTKTQYLNKLRQQFKSREFIHLTFEDNVTAPINTNNVIADGKAFGIQIKQIYNSPIYSDRGYLSLFLNMQESYPVIEVRFWQPENAQLIPFDEFAKRFSIK